MANLLVDSGPFTFNGDIASAVVEANDPSYQLANGTWAAEFNADAIDGRRFLISKDSSGFDNGGHFGLYVEDGDLVLRLQSTSDTTELRIANAIATGTDYHVAFTFGAAGLKLYLDGVEVATSPFTGGMTGNNEPIVFGANQWSSGNQVANRLRDPFDGEISDAEFYDDALTAAEIANLAAEFAPDAVDDALSTEANDALVINVANDLLANDTDADGDPITLDSFTQPANGVVADNGDGTLTYTPNGGYEGPDSFTYTISDGNGGFDTATVNLTVLPVATQVISDDFSDPSGEIAAIWTYEGPVEGAADIAVEGPEAFLTLTLPDGDFDVFDGEYNGARLMQNAPNGDFSVEAKFLSEPNERFQVQGILFEQDDDNWIRFDLRSDGTRLKIFAATTVDGDSQSEFDIGVNAGQGTFLRATRTGDDWVMEYSADGVNFTEAGSFTHALNVNEVGPFAASTQNSDGFVAKIDYFFNTANPIAPEDGVTPTVPDANDDGLNANENTALVIDVDADLLANDTDPEGDPLSIAGFTQPANGTLTDNGDGTLTYTPNLGFSGQDSFTYQATDGNFTSAPATVTVTVAEVDAPDLPTPILDEGPNTFDGSTGSAVILPHDADYLLANGTFAFEFNADNVDGRRFLLSKDSSGFDNGGHVGIYIQDGDLVARFQDTAATTELRADNAISAGVDHHVAITFGAGGLKIYIDGVLAETSAFTGGTIGNEEPIVIGANQWSSGDLIANRLRDAFDGEITSVEIYDNALTDAEINVLANGLPPNANDDAVTTQEDVALVIDVATDILGNDSDPEGDALSIANFAQPDNGTVSDNGDGTLTYTPDAGFSGDDTFTVTITDGRGGFDTSTVTVTVDPGPPPPPVTSDDFSDVSGALLPIWTVEGPGEAGVQTSATDAFLEITLPNGDFDVFNNEYNVARVMQTSPDADFEIEAKFLTEPSIGIQIQGILIEEDNQNWIRYDVRSSGGQLKLFAATTIDGDSDIEFDININPGDAQFLRMTRTGDDWLLEYSADGVTYNAGGTFTHAIEVNEVGPFAGSTGGAPGYTAQVDYFFNNASPIDPEDATLPNVAPVAEDDVFATDADTDLTIDVAADLFANDEDPDGGVLSLVSFTQPANGSVSDNGDGTLTYTPDAGFFGADTFTYTLTDDEGATSDATVTINVDAPPAELASDDFSDASGALLPVWSVEGPAGIDAGIGVSPTDAFLEISVPTGDFDLFNGSYNAARVVQDVTNGDFQAETKFLSEPAARFQIQGVIVEEDDNNWIRFDVRHDGTEQKVFAATTVDGNSTIQFDVAIPTGDAQVLRVTRAGDDWTLEYSADGAVFTEAGSFTHVIEVNEIGPFAGGSGAQPGFTAQVDYFFNTASPIDPEDAVLPNVAPEAADDALAAELETPLTIDVAGDLLGNDSDFEGDVLTLQSFTDPANGVLVDNNDGTLTYSPNVGFTGVDTFTYTVSDGNGGEGTATVSVNVTAGPPPGSAQSDDFSSGDLTGIWNLEGADGSASIQSDGTDAFLAISLPQGDFDLFNGKYNAGRLMQDVANEDFGVEAKFLSEPEQRFQLQGIAIEQDDSNWIRFDLRSDGNSLKLLAATTVNNNTDVEFNFTVQPGEAQYLRVTRTGDDWVFEYSADGVNFANAGSFTHAMTVNEIGPFAGATPAADPYTAQVDYFFNTADPIAPEDAALPASNAAPVAEDDALAVEPDTNLTIDVSSDLLGNDGDPEEAPISFVGFGQPANGTLIDLGGGELRYTPNAGFEGDDTFTYTITDGAGFDTGIATITVSPDGNVVAGPSYVGFRQISSTDGDIPVADLPAEPTVALIIDANGDGLDDFVIGGRRGGPANTLYIQENDGTFTSSVIDSRGFFTEAGGVVYDIDGDGDDDVVMGGASGNTRVFWWENPSVGGGDVTAEWARHTIKSGGGNQQHDMAFGDFDGDGQDEFAFWVQKGAAGETGIFLAEIPADPTNTWAATRISTEISEGMTVGDIDGDGQDDIIVGGYWLKHIGGTNYDTIAIDPTFADPGPQVAVGDLNNDGQLDVVFGSGDVPGPLRWYTYNGDPTVTGNWVPNDILSETFNVHSLEVTDFDGDGNLDIFAAEMRLEEQNPDAKTWVFLGDGQGNFEETVLATGIDHHDSTIGDLDDDGDQDILGKSFDNAELNIFYNEFDTVRLDVWNRVVIDDDRPAQAVFEDHADIDGDGLLDIVAGAHWYKNPGEITGNWARNDFGGGLNNMGVVFDFDGDGDLDVFGTGGVGFTGNNTLFWGENDGSGNFTVRDNLDAGRGSFLQGAVVTTFTEGGPTMIVLSSQNGVGGTYAIVVPDDPINDNWDRITLSAVSQGEGIDAGDIDGDGDNDLLLGFKWLRNEGDGSFTDFDLHIPPALAEPDRVHLVDMDGDGDLDALVGYGHEASIRTLAWYEQPADETGIWTEHVISNDLIGNPQSVDFADLDGDGDIDVVAGEHANPDPGGLGTYVFENTDGVGDTWTQHTVNIGDEQHDGTQLADLDGDGDLDIYSIGFTHDRTVIYENLTGGKPFDDNGGGDNGGGDNGGGDNGGGDNGGGDNGGGDNGGGDNGGGGDPVELPDAVFEFLGPNEITGNSGSVINLAPDPALEIAEGTIAFSFIADETDSRQGLFTKDASGFDGGGNHIAIYVEDNELVARFQDGVDSISFVEMGVQGGTEYEVAATFSATSGVQLFVDGALVDSAANVTTSLTTNVEFLQIGGLGWGSQSGDDAFSNSFDGTISDVQVFAEVLDQDQILELA